MLVSVTGKCWHDPFSKAEARQRVAAWLEKNWISAKESADLIAQINTSSLPELEILWKRPPRYTATIYRPTQRRVVVLTKQPQPTPAEAAPTPPPAPPKPEPPKPPRPATIFIEGKIQSLN